jgi:hypothetical protein
MTRVPDQAILDIRKPTVAAVARVAVTYEL